MRTTATILILAFLFASPVLSSELNIELSSGQTVYVAIYSNVFSGPKELPFHLAATLSIRNTDLHNPLTILSSKYFDNNGNELKEYVQESITLAPLASHHFSVKEDDESGGFGANFIVKWKAKDDINLPAIESVMIGTRSGQGISFVSHGKVIADDNKQIHLIALSAEMKHAALLV